MNLDTKYGYGHFGSRFQLRCAYFVIWDFVIELFSDFVKPESESCGLRGLCIVYFLHSVVF